METRKDNRLIRKTAVDLVAEEIRSRILSGELEPGAPLRQEALSEELGVSRIPFREAMRQLSSEGFVDLIPHRGSFVSMVSKEEVRELFDLRLRLEPWLMGGAAASISTTVLDEAETLVTEMDAVEAYAWGRLNWELHQLLYSATGRPVALALVRLLHEKTERYFRFQVVNVPIRKQAHEEHLALIELCRERQASDAETLMVRHITCAADQILSVVDQLLKGGLPR